MTTPGANSVGLNPSVGSKPVGFITKFTFDVAVTNGTITLSEMRFVSPISSESGRGETLSRTCTRDGAERRHEAGHPGERTDVRLHRAEVLELADADAESKLKSTPSGSTDPFGRPGVPWP